MTYKIYKKHKKALMIEPIATNVPEDNFKDYGETGEKIYRGYTTNDHVGYKLGDKHYAFKEKE